MNSARLIYFLLVSLIVSTTAIPSNVSEIIRAYGYPCEDYEALTSDGYYLSMQRIPYGIKSQTATRGVVLFQHGLTDCSVGSVLNDPSESLPFILADAGYDVWLGNNRGNGYSMKNIHYTTDQPEFWDFSWDEMAEFDLPTQINFALQKSGAKQLSYIGHSEGTTQAFAGFLNPDVSAKVNLFIALAPAVFVSNTESLICKALAYLPTVSVFNLLGIKEFNLPSAIHKLLPEVCVIAPRLCNFDIELICGPTTFLNESRISFYSTFEPNPTSVKNMAHWGQQVYYGTYSKFDYGTQGNIEHYGQPTPPQYDLTKFPSNLPVVIFNGGEDYLADPKDIQLLLGLLPYPPYVHTEVDYAHLDFLIGYNANERIYPLVLKFLEQYNK